VSVGSGADTGPHLRVWGLDDRAVALALLLHGGAEHGTEAVSRWSGPPLRMMPFGWAVRRRSRSIAVARLRFRRRGWNGAVADPVLDVVDALDRLAARRPDVPVILVGHSMGGRAAIAVAGDPRVRGVVALAPWIPSDDPIDQLAGRDLCVVHGTRDRRTSPEGSARFVRRVDGVARSACFIPVPGGDHAMLRHFRRWHRITAEAVVAIAERSPEGRGRPGPPI
jgi:alpha-beta hydrolase superfamily lysophospholipase